METLAILKNPRLSVGDRGLVTLQFDAALENCQALQVLYLETPAANVAVDCKQFIELIKAAGSFERLEGLPIIVERGSGTMLFVRPAAL